MRYDGARLAGLADAPKAERRPGFDGPFFVLSMLLLPAGERASAEVIRPGDYGEILSFARDWVRENASTHDAEALEREERMIGKQMAHFEALRLSGVVLRIDGVIKGFSYGTKLSDEFYDTIAEKADRNIPHIYKVLRAEATKQCCMDCRYVNYEEDLGIPGLRYIKTAYRPEFLLNKYIAAEKE